MDLSNKKFIVSGGGGFVGRALCLKLKEYGAQVISIARSDYPELRNKGIKHLQHDISQPFNETNADFKDADGFFHTASKVDMWGKYKDFYNTNVTGTKNVIAACKMFGIKNLVYTSSPSVIADGSDTAGIDESYPYPKKYKAYYPQTKALAEQMVLAANTTSFRCIALRPHLIWGPGDRHLVPTVIERAKAGKLIQVGSGENFVDTTFIHDCVTAHILAMVALLDRSGSKPNIGGRAYFISQGEPVKLWHWINTILHLNNLPPVSKKIPKGLALTLAAICEAIYRTLPLKGDPLLTRFLVSQMSTAHYFNITAAARDFGFKPEYTIAQALAETFPQNKPDIENSSVPNLAASNL